MLLTQAEADSRTFEECATDPPDTVYYDYFEEGVRVLILRGPASVNTYLGVPASHPLAGHPYGDLPISCHGGLTFAKAGNDKPWPTGYFWYGYDYGHCDDRSFYDLTYPSLRWKDAVGWTPAMVKGEAWNVAYDLAKLMKLAEVIVSRRP